VSVITRTTGDRDTLADTLLCMAAQTDNDFEVLLMVNAATDEPVAKVARLVESFGPEFRARVRVDHSSVMHRVAPLNRALDSAHGHYIVVLDDDDLVVADWIEQFHRVALLHPGSIVRCRAVDQSVESHGDGGTATATSGFTTPYRPEFEFASHLIGGQSPQGSLCCPVEVIDEFGLRFDEDMVVCEDIEFYLRVASVCGVVDTATFGMVYRRWESRYSSGHTVPADVWEASMQKVLAHLDARPLLLPEGSATRLYQAAAQEMELYLLDMGLRSLRARLGAQPDEWAAPLDALRDLESRYAQAVAERDHERSVARDAAAHPVRQIRRSTTAILRHLISRCRSLLSRPRVGRDRS
jgi:glycosyltransferase involved in cell wall biosynthesis